MLSVENISKSFKMNTGHTLTALDSVSFNLRSGGIVALVGPDGAGKSTLLRIVAGLLRPDSGRLLFEGKTLAKGTPESIKNRTEGMSYLVKPSANKKPRSLQAKLLELPGIIDAVPQGSACTFRL